MRAFIVFAFFVSMASAATLPEREKQGIDRWIPITSLLGTYEGGRKREQESTHDASGEVRDDFNQDRRVNARSDSTGEVRVEDLNQDA